MSLSLIESMSDTYKLTELFEKLKSIYNVDSVSEDRKNQIVSMVEKYGYLPYSHIQALEEISDAETIIGIEAKLCKNDVYEGGKFSFSELSPAKRAGFKDSSWIKAEQHNVKLINLAGLGNGNKKSESGKFIDWLRQVLILPAGNAEKGVLSTTVYLIPFHPRDFGCAYLPVDSSVSKALEDSAIREEMGLDAKSQVKLFLSLSQLCGHPTMYDVLPQTGRFSRIVLSNPFVARWFDIKELISKLNADLIVIADEMKQSVDAASVDRVKSIISNSLNGNYENIPEELKEIAEKIEEKLNEKRDLYSNEMLYKENQKDLCARAKAVINGYFGRNPEDKLQETDITDHGGVIGTLIGQGLWPAPGGAWCSSGVPVFDKMAEGAGYPLFRHFDPEGADVTHYANLNCQTPYFFVHFETGEYNESVIEFYISYLKELQRDYNFDAFRVDHIDHIVDKVSEENGRPISYRAPRLVLGRANAELKKENPTFGTLAEYMLWDNFYKEYHQDMNFDLLWGNDIVSQYLKSVEQIIEDNEYLANYNSKLEEGYPLLSVLKIYNNQDGEFEAIDQYPGQLGEDGALFKFFKFKFLPAGKLAQRPVMYLDGDESFTKRGIEKAINTEESQQREDNREFFRKFEAINRFALNNDFARFGRAELNSTEENGLVSWSISLENNADEKLFIVANQQAPTEVVRSNDEAGNLQIVTKYGKVINNVEQNLPSGHIILNEFILTDESIDFEEVSDIRNFDGNKLNYTEIKPSQFFVYKIKKA